MNDLAFKDGCNPRLFLGSQMLCEVDRINLGRLRLNRTVRCRGRFHVLDEHGEGLSFDAELNSQEITAQQCKNNAAWGYPLGKGAA